MTLKWLNRYVRPDSGNPLWETVHRACGVAFVSDSRSLLVADDPAATFAPPEFAGVGSLFRGDEGAKRHEILTRALIENPPDDAIHADLFDLWLWLDRVERVPCGDCNGTGRYRAYHGPDAFPCLECNGEGWFPVCADPDDPQNTVSLLGLPFDRNRLAWWLPGELADVCGGRTECRVFVFTHGAVPSLAIVGRGWRLICASLNRDMNPQSYRTYLLGAGVWWSQRRDRIATLAADDWAQERGLQAGELWGCSL